ncbi:deaminase domain-containing protein [Arthrobacter sp. NPDC057009]|uniref:deaminase domain-containing protein n=1 Tax=Arthrobacter sp. NPDC057009 TaxID=3345996 RepID=UPI00363B048E
MLHVLQRSAGNAAVASYVQRLAESPGPVRPAGLAPGNDPRFLAVTSKAATQAKALRRHPSPQAEVDKVKNAAVPPAGDKEAQAKEAQSATMAAAKPAGFDKAGFIAAVKAAIAAQAPKTLEEAEDFGGSGKSEAVKGQVAGKVTDGKAASAKDIAEKTAATPDQSKAVEKPVTPLAPEAQPAAAGLNAAVAMPAPAPAQQTDLSGGKRDTDAAMAEADVSEQQLATSNEPELVGAVAAKKAGEEHSASAPAAFRTTEAARLGAAKQAAQGAGADGLGGMLVAKKGALGKSAAAKGSAKSKDEAERAKVAGEVKAIFDGTKKEVDSILGALDGTVSAQFTDGEKKVRDAFTADVKKRMADYKNRRYSGLGGDLLWAKDKIFNLPKEADQEYVAARLKYEKEMAALIGRIADTIGDQLTKAKERIAKGRSDIKAYVDSKPKNLQKVAQTAASQFASQFDQLETDVDSKKDALVNDLAAKYVESRTAVDAQITAMQEENKGYWDKAKNAVGGAIKTIIQLKDMLMSVLARTANAVAKIIKDPIGFLGNFVNAVKGGIVQFGQNIAEHLKKGLQGWLLGALAEGGIELPARFDLKGIVQLLMSIFGLTVAHIKARIAAKIGAPALEKVMQGLTVIKVLVEEGVGGLWKWVKEKVGDVKEMIMSQIQQMVSVEIIKAGIVWLISMLNPASAFIKACKMIYDVVMFFVEKAEQIKAFVDSVLDSVESIAAGGVGAVAGYIEKTLAKMLPVLIGFLASLLGLGGISGKIKKLLETLQKPINAVVDWVVTKAIKYGKKFLGFAKKVGGKVRAKGKELLGKAKKKLGVKQTTPEQIEKAKKDRLLKGVSAAVAAANRFAGKPVSGKLLIPILAAIKIRYRMSTLELIPHGKHWSVHGVVNPDLTEETLAEMEAAMGELKAALKPWTKGSATARGKVMISGYPGRTTIEMKSGRRGPAPRSDITGPAGHERHVLRPFEVAKDGTDPDPRRIPKFGSLEEKEEWLRANRVTDWPEGKIAPGHGDRVHDAENKILEEIAETLRKMLADGKTVKGSIYILANKEICPSCEESLHRFSGEFRGKVQVVASALGD